jgi:hypothetical protein
MLDRYGGDTRVFDWRERRICCRCAMGVVVSGIGVREIVPHHPDLEPPHSLCNMSPAFG